jgi:uncharacterized membrane protein YgdD (TMEM256/DUF423 family)
MNAFFVTVETRSSSNFDRSPVVLLCGLLVHRGTIFMLTLSTAQLNPRIALRA